MQGQARPLIVGGGGGVYSYIHAGYARLVCFEIRLISKEISPGGPEYMNKSSRSPPPN